MSRKLYADAPDCTPMFQNHVWDYGAAAEKACLREGCPAILVPVIEFEPDTEDTDDAR